MGYAGLHSNLEKSHQKWSSPSTLREKNGRSVPPEFFEKGVSLVDFPNGLLINVFRQKKTRKSEGQHVISFLNLLQNPRTKILQNTFRQKQETKFHGIRIETHKSFPHTCIVFLHQHFPLKKRNFPRFLPSHQRKSGPKN